METILTALMLVYQKPRLYYKASIRGLSTTAAGKVVHCFNKSEQIVSDIYHLHPTLCLLISGIAINPNNISLLHMYMLKYPVK